MEIKYPITVYYIGCENTLHEATFEGPPIHHFDSHWIDKKTNQFVDSAYDINNYFYLDRKEAVSKLRKQLKSDIKDGERELKRNRELLAKLK